MVVLLGMSVTAAGNVLRLALDTRFMDVLCAWQMGYVNMLGMHVGYTTLYQRSVG